MTHEQIELAQRIRRRAFRGRNARSARLLLQLADEVAVQRFASPPRALLAQFRREDPPMPDIDAGPHATTGHNSRRTETTDDRLRLLVERVERLEEEKKGIGDDISDVYKEARAVGYDVKIMRQIVRLRKMAPDDRKEMEAILDLYKSALGLG